MSGISQRMNGVYQGVVALLGVSMMVVSTAPLDAAEALQWKFSAGDAQSLVLKEDNDIAVNLNGIEVAAEFGLALFLTREVKSVDSDGNAVLDQHVDRIIVDLFTPFTGEFKYDSQSEETPESPMWQFIGPVFENLIGQTIVTKVTPNGEMVDFQLPEKLVKAMAALEENEGEGDDDDGDGRRGGGGPPGQMMAILFGGGLSEATIRDLVSQTIIVLPENGTDASWKSTTVTPMQPIGQRSTTFNYQRTDADDGSVEIAFDTDVGFELAELEDIDVELEITESEGSGTIAFDANTGRATGMKRTQFVVFEGIIGGSQDILQEVSTSTVLAETASPGVDPEADNETGSAE